MSVTTTSTHSDELLEKFWSLEEPPSYPPTLTPAEIQCEEHFNLTTSRLPDGKFCVKLPFVKERQKLGSSYNSAMRRFISLERKFKTNKEFSTAYHNFMSEYLSLGHMSHFSFNPDENSPEYYMIPHHGIWQQSTNGMKLRVVFDASAKTSSGLSLNDVLYTGPALQADITDVINYFREHRYVLTADIEKMYRQIVVHPSDRHYQLILWRNSDDQPVTVFSLNTVTYGESCSPYLALRSLQELVNTDGALFPAASKVLTQNRYVDDIFIGHDDPTEILKLKSQTIELLKRGGFQLKKWASNEQSLIANVPKSDLANPLIFTDKCDFTIRTLEISWNPVTDDFSYKFSANELTIWTKRTLLSETAKLYDPLGWISPIVLKLKAVFQETWVRQLDWDVNLPDDLKQEWISVKNELSLLEDLQIPRHFGFGRTEIHGFADASKTAYAAAIYLKRISADGSISVQLLVSKTKLALIKQISIPRLELCAAHLVAKLINHVKAKLPFASNITLWSDSSTVLAWIKSMPKKWSTFVGNRISHIHELCPNIKWFYVPSAQNPADIASRGTTPSKLIHSDLWWKGPVFLADLRVTPPEQADFHTIEEQAPIRIHVAQIQSNFWNQFIDRFSNFSRLTRSTTYIFRFINNMKRSDSEVGTLSANELKSAWRFLIQTIQQSTFEHEISSLKENVPLSRSSSIRSLLPFLDKDGLLRVGGRLTNTPVDNFNPQPILIPNCKYSSLLIQKIHNDNFHGGINLICSQVRQTFWMIGLKRLA